jgi:hypothetical protein
MSCFQTTSFDTAIFCPTKDRRIKEMSRGNLAPFDTPKKQGRSEAFQSLPNNLPEIASLNS